MLLLNDTIKAELKEGKWIYKANENLKLFKKNGVLKAVYQDLPRYPVIYKYEGNMKKEYRETLSVTVKQMTVKLIEFSQY